MTLCQRSKVILRKVPSAVTPALLTSTSTGPSSLRTLSKAARVDSQSATLPSEAWTSCPSARMSAIQRSLRCEPGPQPATTRNPSRQRRLQIAVPMPPIPPVT